MKTKQILKIWKDVFSKWRYVFLTIVVALVFYSVNVLISSWKSLVGFYPSLGFFGTLKFFSILALGFKSTIVFHSFVSLVIISILFGMLASLIFYKVSFNSLNKNTIKTSKKASFFGGVGVFLAAFIPGCVSCGIGLASVLGVSAGFLSFLPYDGLELSVISIGFLGFAILKISNNMYKCNIPVWKHRDERRLK